MNKSESINELAAALSKAQGEMKDADKTAKSYNGKYAELDKFYEIIRAAFCKHGLSFKQDTVSQNVNEIKVQTWIMHSSGQYMMSELTVPVVAETGNRNNPLHNIGKASTYARRYAIAGAVGICQKEEDDDADSLTEDKAPQFPKAQQYPKKEFNKEEPKSEPWKMDEIKLNYFKDLLVSAKYTEDRVFTRYGITELINLTEEQYNQSCRVFNKAIADLKKGEAK